MCLCSSIFVDDCPFFCQPYTLQGQIITVLFFGHRMPGLAERLASRPLQPAGSRAHRSPRRQPSAAAPWLAQCALAQSPVSLPLCLALFSLATSRIGHRRPTNNMANHLTASSRTREHGSSTTRAECSPRPGYGGFGREPQATITRFLRLIPFFGQES